MWLKLLIWVMWSGVEGAAWADGACRGDRTDGADMAETALLMNALFYLD